MLLFEPLLCCLGLMFWVIVMLEDPYVGRPIELMPNSSIFIQVFFDKLQMGMYMRLLQQRKLVRARQDFNPSILMVLFVTVPSGH